MRLFDIYRRAIKIGINKDPRGKTLVTRVLREEREKFQRLTTKQKIMSGREHLGNPYADTAIIFGDPDIEIRGKVLVGIDIGAEELLLADRLRDKGEEISCVISHHPVGRAFVKFFQVMNMQKDILHKSGIPINIADGIMQSRIDSIRRSLLPVNVNREHDIARILGLPLICIHTPADNCVNRYLQEIMDKNKPEKVREIIDILNRIPEYQEADKTHQGPTVLVGNPESRTGKILVDMTGGTEGDPELFGHLARANVGTIVGMHFSEAHKKEAETNHLRMIIAGHIASDTLGMNLLLDYVFARKKVEFIDCAGFRRVER